MSFGLGYIADGFLKGQERNTNFGLRRNQERREETKFGLQVPVLEAEKVKAEEFMSDESKLARANKQTNDGVISNNNATISGYDAIIKGNDASTNNIARINRERDAKVLGAENLAKGYGLGNTIKRQQIRSGEEQFTPEAIEFRKKQQEFAIEAQAWDQNLRKIVNQRDQLKARIETSEAIDNRDFSVLQLVRSGESAGAATLINGFGDNPHGDIVDVKQTKEGGVVGYNQKGEVAVSYTPEQVAGLESRIKARAAKAREAKAPTLQTFEEPVLDENGKQIIDTDGKPAFKKVQRQYNYETKSWDPANSAASKQTTDPDANDSGLQKAIDDIKSFYDRKLISKEQYESMMKTLNAKAPQGKEIPTESSLFSRLLGGPSTSSSEAPQQQYQAPRMGRGLRYDDGANTPEQSQQYSSSPRGRQDPVGGLNNYLDELFNQPSAPRPLSRNR